jgi:ubiquinone/menaquinone biosynthesis C-methylase UbiE
MRPSRVVDIGCGTGQLTTRLADHFSGARVIGFDYSAGMLAQAQNRLHRSETTALGRADATNLPCAPNSVDLITCTESFHWYREQVKALRDMHTALRPGGRVVIGSIAAFSALEQRALEHLSSRIDQPIRALTASRIVALMEGVGLRVIAQRRVPRPSILLPLPLLTIGHKPG